MIDQCNAGGYIVGQHTLSKPGRVIIAGSGADEDAYISVEGSHFSDAFVNALTPNASLSQAFQMAHLAMSQSQRPQTPQLDANGNGILNEASDADLANARYLFAARADRYEPDDTCTVAGVITTDGQGQQHSLHVAEDRDWLQFAAEAGRTYRVVVKAATPDLQLEVHGNCRSIGPMALVEAAQDGATRLRDLTVTVTAVRSGVYFIKMTSAHDRRLDYTIAVEKQPTRVYLPVILHLPRPTPDH